MYFLFLERGLDREIGGERLGLGLGVKFYPTHTQILSHPPILSHIHSLSYYTHTIARAKENQSVEDEIDSGNFFMASISAGATRANIRALDAVWMMGGQG